ncbi:MAG: YceD family protein [Acidimicrobiales bacterium]
MRALRSRAGTRQDLELAGSIPGLSIPGAGVAEDVEVHFVGWVESTPGGVTVAGRVTAPWSGMCRRCLETARGTIEADVRELCIDPRDTSIGEPDVTRSDDEMYRLGADELDIEPIVRDACILDLPLAPLCSESCGGLCPSCGANRNKEMCSCAEPSDERWSGLASLGAGEAAQVVEQVQVEQVEETEQEAE